MKLQELRDRALQLSLSERWRLVQSLLSSIQQETLWSNDPDLNANSLLELDPWTQSLMSAIQLSGEDTTELYVDYLEDKYS
ncbi:MAG: hypothetical protein SW833_06855 [Cyanobacteriota bacterium]|nr:hypothetical protein [Cyanobacteriota bacterium]